MAHAVVCVDDYTSDTEDGTVTIGGIHHQQGRVPRLRYVFLTAAEEAQLQALAATGVTVVAQDVPSGPAIPLADVLSGDGTR